MSKLFTVGFLRECMKDCSDDMVVTLEILTGNIPDAMVAEIAKEYTLTLDGVEYPTYKCLGETLELVCDFTKDFEINEVST